MAIRTEIHQQDKEQYHSIPSYRDRLLAGETNKNPSPLIDELLKDNRGFLIFQEDTIKFLQNICGLSGSAADNVRREIGRKQMDRLQKALPDILNGYCKMSSQPRLSIFFLLIILHKANLS